MHLITFTSNISIPMNIRKFYLAFVFFSFSVAAIAQNNDIHLYGQLYDSASGKKMKEGSVLVKRDGIDFMLEPVQKGSKYDLLLPVGSVYDVKFDGPGHLHKIIRIDAKNVPLGKKVIGCDMHIDAPLYSDMEGFNEEVLAQPIGWCKYSEKLDGMEFDIEYGNRRQLEVKNEIDRIGEGKHAGRKK